MFPATEILSTCFEEANLAHAKTCENPKLIEEHLGEHDEHDQTLRS